MAAKNGKQAGPWMILDSKTLYQNAWIKVIEDKVIQPDGKEGKYGVVFMLPGISVLAIDDDGSVYLNHEYRYAYKRDSIEVISGGLEVGEDPLNAARRELQEEAGLKAEKLEFVGELDPFTSVIKSKGYLYIATGLSKTQRNLDSTERIQVDKIPIKQALRWVDKGIITHAATIVLLMRAQKSLF